MQLRCVGLFAAVLLLSGTTAYSAPFNPTNILVTQRPLSGQNIALLEYTRSGQLVQQLPVPVAGPEFDSLLDIDDVTVDPFGRAHVLTEVRVNSVRHVGVSTYDGAAWSSRVFPEPLTSTTFAYEGTADVVDNRLFSVHASHHQWSSLSDGSSGQIPSGSVTTIGLDRKYYAVNRFPSPNHIDVYNVDTYALERTISVPQALRSDGLSGVAVDTNGDIFLTSFGNRSVYRLGPNGTLLGSIVLGEQLNHIDLHPDGTLAAASRFGKIFVLNKSLNPLTLTSFITPENASSSVAFATYILPEPSSVVMMCVGSVALLCAAYRKRARARPSESEVREAVGCSP